MATPPPPQVGQEPMQMQGGKFSGGKCSGENDKGKMQGETFSGEEGRSNPDFFVTDRVQHELCIIEVGC